jgi:serine/threonine protein kinase
MKHEHENATRVVTIQKPSGTASFYVIGREIGKGSCGEVHEATPVTAAAIMNGAVSGSGVATCALKYFNSPLLNTRPEMRAQCLDSFNNELWALREIRPHRNLLHPIEYAISSGEHKACALVYPLMSRSLRGYKVDCSNHLLFMIWQIASGLVAIHSAGFVHGDIKPDNILENTCNGELKITDFGISVRVRNSNKQEPVAKTHRKFASTHVLATPWYRDPDMMGLGCGRTRMVSAASDIWSLGVTVFELVVGRSPFVSHAEDAKVTDDAVWEMIIMRRVYEEFGVHKLVAPDTKLDRLDKQPATDRVGKLEDELRCAVTKLCADSKQYKQITNFMLLWKRMMDVNASRRISALQIVKWLGFTPALEPVWNGLCPISLAEEPAAKPSLPIQADYKQKAAPSNQNTAIQPPFGAKCTTVSHPAVDPNKELVTAEKATLSPDPR